MAPLGEIITKWTKKGNQDGFADDIAEIITVKSPGSKKQLNQKNKRCMNLS
jgi:hypothetical protein